MILDAYRIAPTDAPYNYFGINITHSQDTALPFLAQLIAVGKRHCRVLACHSDETGNDMTHLIEVS